MHYSSKGPKRIMMHQVQESMIPTWIDTFDASYHKSGAESLFYTMH